MNQWEFCVVETTRNSNSSELFAAPPFPLPLTRLTSRPILRAAYASDNLTTDAFLASVSIYIVFLFCFCRVRGLLFGLLEVIRSRSGNDSFTTLNIKKQAKFILNFEKEGMYLLVECNARNHSCVIHLSSVSRPVNAKIF